MIYKQVADISQRSLVGLASSYQSEKEHIFKNVLGILPALSHLIRITNLRW